MKDCIIKILDIFFYVSMKIEHHLRLTPKLLWPVFFSFLKFGSQFWILVRVLMLNF